MRALAIGGGLLGLVLTVGIIGWLLVGGGSSSVPPGGAPGPRGAASPGYVGGLIDAKARAAASIALATLRQRLQQHRALNGRYPASLEELEAGEALPALPKGVTYRYDAATGTIEAE